MRRRLAGLALATTGLVVISLLVPLGLLVRRQASEQARLEAERDTRSVAGLAALAMSVAGEETNIEAAVGPLPDGLVVGLPDGSFVGALTPGQGTLIAEARTRQATLSAIVEGGWEMALPVVGRSTVLVVDVFVTDDELTAGVASSWLLLALLGLALVGVAVVLADRLGRRLVGPVGELASAARQMGTGDLGVRVDVTEPEELMEVGRAFNELAGRLAELLAEERESVADLSHGLRTPLTSLRLQVERVSDDVERQELINQVDRLEQSIDRLIVDARGTSVAGSGVSVLDVVVSDRLAFWRVLADEQDREMTIDLGSDGALVAGPGGMVQTIVDVLVGNVFSHTEPGTPLDVRTRRSGALATIEVFDRGPGFRGLKPERGVSGGGSTGLGLDIVRKAAALNGGSLEVNDRPGGGAVVRVHLGTVS